MKLEDLNPAFADALVSTRIPAVRKVLDEIVVLKEDRIGRYVEYAFKEGMPEHPRCLDWKAKQHPNAWIREWKKDSNGNVLHSDGECITMGLNRLLPLGDLYRLVPQTCGGSCEIGHKPPESCNCENWTYDEPVKCACWHLSPLQENDLQVSIGLEDLFSLVHEDVPVDETCGADEPVPGDEEPGQEDANTGDETQDDLKEC